MHVEPDAGVGQNFRNSGGQVFRNPHLDPFQELRGVFYSPRDTQMDT
jgi:hypothetical protein